MPVSARRCVVCGQGGGALCSACVDRLDPPPSGTVHGLGPVPALFAYAGHGAVVVQHLKFRDGRRLIGPLVIGLAALAQPWVESVDTGAAVSWVPTSPRRRRQRGFDQAELLARALARRVGLPAVPSLTRGRGPAQTGRSRHERSDVEFAARRGRARPLLLLDDVCTTGATLRAATEAARRAGHLPTPLTVARTP